MEIDILNFNNDEILKNVTIEGPVAQDFYSKMISKYGVIVYKNLWSKRSIENLLDQFKFHFENSIDKYLCPQGENAPKNVTNLWPSFLEDNSITNLLNELNDKIEFLNFLKTHFDGDFFTGKTNVMSTHRTGPSSDPIKYKNWHSDNASMRWDKKLKALTFWSPLVSVGRLTAPGLRVCAKKFDNDIFDYTGDQNVWKKFEDEYYQNIIFPEVEPGDCIIFDNHTLHGTAFTFEQSSTRYSLDFRFLSKKNHPIVNDSEKIFVNDSFQVTTYFDYINQKTNFSKRSIKNFIKKILN